MRIYICATAIIIAGFLVHSNLMAQDVKYSERKADLMKYFTEFITWPHEENIDVFKIKVFGDQYFYKYLKYLYADIKIKGKVTEIEYVDSPEGVLDCEVLFIASVHEELVEEIFGVVKGKPILTVGDSAGYAQKGALFNFYHQNQKVLFEMNYNVYKESPLKINSRLLDVAKIIN
ncbi:YfiR family protein [Flexithrix dorotheae]|uniref:YfiR family protein n=1 Tax=Flexithrix dorotheae TaxID=70993 RepID=UPI0012FC3AD6|nr:YfiR family protein [Flexithrix dorotheae]